MTVEPRLLYRCPLIITAIFFVPAKHPYIMLHYVTLSYSILHLFIFQILKSQPI